MILHREIHFFMASLPGFATAVIIGLMFAGESIGKDLRPSEHGLEFQNSPSAWLNYSSEMRSFFNSSQASNSSDIMTMPKPTNSSDSSRSSWWSNTDGGERNHVRNALVVASLVCGVTGVILLVATGLLFLSKHRKHKHEVNESCSDKDNDKLQLAVRTVDP
ncbi:uncharacterized protein LOC129287149 [Prosopis cineraria]|uniref:uncharacterized protein LOC129287149 n=1 Tax=Prosopis cineraria TaxID=364024 RepID=UPI00240FE445|nr:uncharacterized protein LOC129287149 [Prosopis cineraria]